MISALNLCKNYGGQTIFKDVTFNISQSERVGLVGRNGHGKTTLFKLVNGEEVADEGVISVPKDYKIGYLSQDIVFSKPTILEEGCCALPENQQEDEWKVKKILSGLGFDDSDFLKDPAKFSGGFQIRLNLAKVLISEPNLLLLDEPTNFLDIISIRWLIKFLNSWRNELLIISHDRNFMDSIVTHIMGIHRTRLKKIAGHTQNYYDQISIEEEVYEKERLNKEKKRKQTEVFISRFRAKARQASMVQSRVKSLEKQDILKKIEKTATLLFSFTEAACPAKYLLEVCDLTFSYNSKLPYLIKDLNFAIEKNDRICIVGKNGKGKTSLLKLLAGDLQPVNGNIKIHPLTQKAYFEQANTAKLNDDLTIEDEILLSCPDIGKKFARDICGTMMFSGDSALKRISVLSGGEKCRVLFGKILIKPSNILLLDEPTHHLDMESSESLIGAINRFNGAAIIVTHNEYMLEKIANKLIVFHDEKIFMFHGSYSEYLEKIGWGDQDDSMSKEQQSSTQTKKRTVSTTRKDNKKLRAEFITRRSKTLKPLQKNVDDLEKLINEAENQLKDETESLIEASQEQDGDKIAILSKSLKETRSNIEKLYDSLEKASNEYEQAKLIFEEEGENLNI